MLKTSKNAASEAKDLERSYKLADIVKQRQKTLRTPVKIWIVLKILMQTLINYD